MIATRSHQIREQVVKIPWSVFISKNYQNDISKWSDIKADDQRCQVVPQAAWDVSETSQLGLRWERLLKDISETSQKRRLFWDVFETSQIHLEKDVFLATSSRRLKERCLFWDIFKTSRIHLKRDVFYVTSWRCLKFISKKMYYRGRLKRMSPGEGWEECPKIVTNDDIVTISHYFRVLLSPLTRWHPFLMAPKIHIFWYGFEIGDSGTISNGDVTTAHLLKRYCTPATTSYFMKLNFLSERSPKNMTLKKPRRSESSLDHKLCQFLYFNCDFTFDKLLELPQISCIILH